MLQETGPFITVLIDGDNTLVSRKLSYGLRLTPLTSKFLDNLVQASRASGERAAKKLQDAI